MDTNRRQMFRQTLENIDEKIKHIPELASAMDAVNAGDNLNTAEMAICKMYKDLKKFYEVRESGK